MFVTDKTRHPFTLENTATGRRHLGLATNVVGMANALLLTCLM